MIDNSKKRSRDKSDTPPGASWVLVKLEDKINIIKSWEHETPESLPLFVMPEAIESDSYYFVAHSRQDFKIVYTDILRLESVGVDIWYDRAMEPSKDWRELAKRMMNRQECKGVIVYGTVSSMVSEPVQTELLVADELGKNIIFINHGEDLKTTAAKDLYEKACKKAEETRGADCAREEPTEEDRKRVERFEELLARKGNPNITYIDLAHNAARKKELLDKIKSEEVLLYDKSGRDRGVITGVKYLGVREVKIPKNVTIDGKEYDVIEIGACAFANCRALEMVEFPETLEEIGEHAFFGCASLTKVHLGRYVWFVAENAFENCENLEEVTATEGNERIIVKDRVHYIHQHYYDEFGIFFVPRDLKGAITLLDGLKTIKPYTFAGRDSLTSVTIGDSVTSIGNYAFENCTSLTSVTIGDSVTSIGNYAFEDCTSLTSIVIPDSVTSIGARAFDNCDSLTSIVIPDSVTSIGSYAFSSCTSLTSITIPDSVTSIGSYAFRGCTSLASVAIRNGVTSIESYAFSACTALTSITIPDSVTSIGRGAFSSCSSLESLTIPFVGATKGGTSYMHFGYIFGAWNDSYNGGYVPASLKEVIITGGTSIRDYAFEDCTSLTSITIPDGVASIGDYAFSGCDSLTSVTIPDGVASIGENAFRFCWSLRHVTYSGTVRQWKKLTAKCQGWTGYCPCEVVKCKDGEAPVTAEDRGE